MLKFRRHSLESSWVKDAVTDFLALAEAFPPDRPARICLAGGGTPAPVYAAIAAAMDRLAAERLDAEQDGRTIRDPDAPTCRWTFFLGDERVGDAGDAERNETMVRAVFGPVLESGLAELVAWGRESVEAMDSMDAELARRVPADEPLFDLCYLGLGADGHTAGIFPGTRPPYEGRTLGSRAPSAPRERVSLSLDALRSSVRTRFLVRAPGKERALARLAERDRTCPAFLAASDDTLVFVLA